MGQFQSTQVCTTPACINTASSILMNLAPHWRQLDPCTNFEEMVCYGFKERVSIGDPGPETLNQIGRRNPRILKQIFEGDFSDAVNLRSSTLRKRTSADELNFNMLRQTYDACMDAEAIEKKGVEPLNQLLKEISKDLAWPYITDFSKKADAVDLDAFANAAAAFGKLGASPWSIGTYLEPDTKEPSRAITAIQSFVGTPEKLDDEEANKKMIASLNETFSTVYPVQLDANETLHLAQGVFTLRFEVAKAYLEVHAELQKKLGRTVTSDNTFKMMPFPEVAALAPELRMDKVVAGILPAGYKGNVMVGFAEALPAIGQIIKNQPVPVLQAALAVVAIESLKNDVAFPGSEEKLKATDRWETCLDRVNSQVGYLADRFFVQHTYTEQGRAASFKMIERIKAEFKKRLATYSWMDDQAKKRAIKKVDNMIEEVGYQSENPNVMSPDSLASWYSTLNVTGDHFSNVVSARRHESSVKQSVFVKDYPRSQWPKRTSETNAFYKSQTNAIYIHAGISRSPLFHPDLPQYALYGALGSILGHEVTHGFDVAGSQYDENARKQEWWDNSTMAAYQEKSQCFVEQYSKFEAEVPNGEKKAVDGVKSLGENQSDAAGLSISYAAWQEERKSMPDVWDQSLPGLEDFTHEQLFFIMYANTWCSNYSPETNLVELGKIHALPKFRIAGGTANSRAFKEAFKCKNKEPECELW